MHVLLVNNYNTVPMTLPSLWYMPLTTLEFKNVIALNNITSRRYFVGHLPSCMEFCMFNVSSAKYHSALPPFWKILSVKIPLNLD